MSREIAPVPRSRGALRPDPRTQQVIDVALGVAGLTAGVTIAAARTASKVVGPIARLVWRPPVVAHRYQPATIVAGFADTGRVEREALLRRAGVLLDAWVPALTEALVERLDLTRLVEQHVSLDELVGTVDLDAAVARVDLDAAVARVDLDKAVARVAIDAILDRVDLDDIASRLDVDAVVARADLDAAVERVDIEKVIARVDVIGIVEEVLDEIDLPGIIRESSGSMASETVRGVRMTGISADDAISRAVDRALFRRRNRPSPDGAAP